MNKKGAITDIFIFIVMAVALVLVVGVFLFGANEIKDTLEASPGLLSPELNLSDAAKDTVSVVVDGMDEAKMGTFILIFGMFLSIIVTSFLVRVHPLFFFIYLFVTIIAVIMAVPISNFYETFLTDPTLSVTFAGFTASNFILLNLPIWVTVVGLVGAMFLLINMNRGEGFEGPI